jgi:hypothetical protein
MLALIGLMLQQANFKSQALIALSALNQKQPSQFASSILAINRSWLFEASSFFLNVSLWVLFVAVGYLLFLWRGDRDEK